MAEPTEVSGDGFTDRTQPDHSGSPRDAATGDDWETIADDRLVDSSFDAELGKEMSRDAIRASRGELSEEEFYAKYHDEVVAEFGVDDRPLPTGENDD
ncbi:MAG: 4Fe-4S ferredoxin N-terminal domain-containing protein [Halobacteriota archaeon]